MMGVTASNIYEKLEYVDGVMIGSWLKDGHRDYGDVCEEYVKEFIDRVREFKTRMAESYLQKNRAGDAHHEIL